MIRKTAMSRMKKPVVAILLALSWAAAHAETGSIVVQGFYDALRQVDRPDYTLHGSFRGTDADHDGVLRSDELEYFNFAGIHYVAPTPDAPATCRDARADCAVTMEYTIGSGTAAISASQVYTGPGMPNFYVLEFGTGVGYSEEFTVDPPVRLLWADYTTMTVTSVPEPSAAGMLLLGLAGLTAAARRRRGQTASR